MRIKFSLRTLLVLAPLAAAALAFVASRVIRHNEVTVVGFMSAIDEAFVSYWQYRPRDVSDDLMERTSDDVLFRAVGSLPPSSRACLEAHGDPVHWLRRNVHITVFPIPGRTKATPHDAELLQVTISNYAPTLDEITAETDVINALLDTFNKGSKTWFMNTVPAVPYSPAGIELHGPAQVCRPGWF
ncbi:MAG TPA: hypothetical protein VG826_36195 [Pirellulales bacterium]|nr:hypothetical protein [Pirellulales bacterium]